MSVTIESWLELEHRQRQFERRAAGLSAELMARRLIWPCRIVDISPRGAGVQLAAEDHLEVGLDSRLRLFGFGNIGSEVRHCRASFVGLMFRHQGSADAAMVRWLASLHIGAPDA